MPTFNSARFVERTLEGLAAQDYPRLRFVFVDDASSDDSERIVESWRARLRHEVVFHRHERNRGVAQALREGLKVSTEGYFAWTGSDDIWPAHYLSSQIAKLKESGADWVVSDVELINSTGQKSAASSPFDHSLLDRLNPHELFARFLRGNFLCGASMVFKDVRQVRRYFAPANDKLQDYELVLHFLTKHRFVRNPGVMAAYRLHEGNLSSLHHLAMRGKYNHVATLHRLLASPDFLAFAKAAPDLPLFASQLSDALREGALYSPSLYALRAAFLEDLSMRSEFAVHEDALNSLLARALWDLGLYAKARQLNVQAGPCRVYVTNEFVPPALPFVEWRTLGEEEVPEFSPDACTVVFCPAERLEGLAKRLASTPGWGFYPLIGLCPPDRTFALTSAGPSVRAWPQASLNWKALLGEALSLAEDLSPRARAHLAHEAAPLPQGHTAGQLWSPVAVPAALEGPFRFAASFMGKHGAFTAATASAWRGLKRLARSRA